MTTRFVPKDAREVVGVANLTAIRVYELRGIRFDGDDDDPDDGVTPDVAIRTTPTEIETRMRMTIRIGGAAITADISAEHTLDTPCDLRPEVVREFAERVGVMSVYPYLRESLSTTASRFGVDSPLLGLIKPGDVRIAPLDEYVPMTPSSLAEELGVTPGRIRTWLRTQGRTPSTNGRWELDGDTVEQIRSHFAGERTLDNA